MENFNDEKIKYPLSDDKFTNEKDIEYPGTNDLVNIKVLNNNTKILNERISTTESEITNNLSNVSRESSPKYIENQVLNINNTLSSVTKESSPNYIENQVLNINDTLSSVAKESSPKYIENQVKSINSTLSSVAKESSYKYIENQVKKLDTIKTDIINSVKTEITKNSGDGNYLNLPNLFYKELGSLTTSTSYRDVFNINRSGYLCGALCLCPLTARSWHGIKIIVDGRVIIWQEIDSRNLSSSITKYGYCGLANVQNQIDYERDSYSYEGRFLGGFKIGVNYIVRGDGGFPIGQFSPYKTYINVNLLPGFARVYGVTLSKIICSKGIRFQRSLQVQYMTHSSEAKITYLYSLDD